MQCILDMSSWTARSRTLRHGDTGALWEVNKASSVFNSAMKWHLELSCSDHCSPDTDTLTTSVCLPLKLWVASLSPALHSMQYDLFQGFHAVFEACQLFAPKWPRSWMKPLLSIWRFRPCFLVSKHHSEKQNPLVRPESPSPVCKERHTRCH